MPRKAPPEPIVSEAYTPMRFKADILEDILLELKKITLILKESD